LLGHVDHELLAGLGAVGARSVVSPSDLASRDEVADGFAFVARRLGPIDIVVLTAIDPVAYETRLLADVDDVHFEAVWEATMQATLWCLQAAFAHMAGRGGRILVAVPTVGMSGAAGLAPLAAAAEGQRVLAKSAARQWGPDGITVNCLAVATEVAGTGSGSVDVMLSPAALGRAARPEEDVGPVAAFLAGPGGGFVTGATLCLDGGVWMAP
jgi:NAD(P)-dependent dehydrogenase (short-subunit alcohol dehydrogenase family)